MKLVDLPYRHHRESEQRSHSASAAENSLAKASARFVDAGKPCCSVWSATPLLLPAPLRQHAHGLVGVLAQVLLQVVRDGVRVQEARPISSSACAVVASRGWPMRSAEQADWARCARKLAPVVADLAVEWSLEASVIPLLEEVAQPRRGSRLRRRSSRVGHQLLVGSGDQSCESCEQCVGLQDDVCGSIAPGFLQGMEHIAVLGACHPRMTNRWASCVTQELFRRSR